MLRRETRDPRGALPGRVRPLDRRDYGRPGARFEKVEPGDEQILPPHEQRELDALPSGLDRDRED
jgi:hypothetical protein